MNELLGYTILFSGADFIIKPGEESQSVLYYHCGNPPDIFSSPEKAEKHLAEEMLSKELSSMPPPESWMGKIWEAQKERKIQELIDSFSEHFIGKAHIVRKVNPQVMKDYPQKRTETDWERRGLINPTSGYVIVSGKKPYQVVSYATFSTQLRAEMNFARLCYEHKEESTFSQQLVGEVHLIRKTDPCIIENCLKRVKFR